MGLILYAIVVVLIYLIYKWLTKDMDYFEKKGVKFDKAIPIFGSTNSMFRQRRSFPDACNSWYNAFPGEK